MSRRPTAPRFLGRPVSQPIAQADSDAQLARVLYADLAPAIQGLIGYCGLKRVIELAPAEQLALFRRLENVLRADLGLKP